MGTGGNEDNQPQLGYEGCVWGTKRVTMGPHEPQSTLLIWNSCWRRGVFPSREQ